MVCSVLRCKYVLYKELRESVTEQIKRRLKKRKRLIHKAIIVKELSQGSKYMDFHAIHDGVIVTRLALAI